MTQIKNDQFLIDCDRAKLESIYRTSPYPSYLNFGEVKIYWLGAELKLPPSEAYEFYTAIHDFYFELLRKNAKNFTEKFSDELAKLAGYYFFKVTKGVKNNE